MDDRPAKRPPIVDPDAPGRFRGGAGIAMLASQVTVETIPTRLPDVALVGRIRINVQNLGPDDLYIGGNGVNTDTGTQLGAGDAFEWTLGAAELWAVSDGSSDVRVLELR